MSEPFLAQISLFAGNFAPRGWALCDGQILPISQNQALFSLLGTTYGGDGRTTFALPDLRGRAAIHEGTGAGLTTRSLGSRGGQDLLPLNESQIPAHTHTASATASLGAHSGSGGDESTPAADRVLGKFQGGAPVELYSDSDANLVDLGGVSATASAANAGGGQGHENRQPLLGINFIIALNGTFPPRN